jgi:hypothetical protein
VRNIKYGIKRSAKVISVVLIIICVCVTIYLIGVILTIKEAAVMKDYISIWSKMIEAGFTSDFELIIFCTYMALKAVFIIGALIITIRLFKEIGRDGILFNNKNSKRVKWIGASFLVVAFIAAPFRLIFHYQFPAVDIDSLGVSISFGTATAALVICFIAVIFKYGAEMLQSTKN